MSTAFSAAAQSGARTIIPEAIFNDEIKLTGENIINMSVTEAVAASDGISMGKTISSKLEMTIKTPETAMLLNDGYVTAFTGFDGVNLPANFEFEDGTLASVADFADDGTLSYEITLEITPEGVLTFGAYDILEYCPLGKFYISKAESDNNFKTTFKVVAYDGFSKTEETYSPTISMPNTAEAILADIASRCGFSISPDIEYPAGEFALYDFTCRQYIGYFAGLVGKNARFNRDGKLTFVWYERHGYTIASKQQYLGGLKRLTDAPFEVRSISSGTSEEVLVAGTGTGISFENPFMTQEIVDGIFQKTGIFSYIPLQVKWRGNPVIEAGDILNVEDKGGTSHTVYVMEQVFKISGGMHSEIKCYGQSEADISFSTSPSQKKLQQVYTKLQQSIQEATTLLNGKNGGVFEILDENGDKIMMPTIPLMMDSVGKVKTQIASRVGGNTEEVLLNLGYTK